MKKIGIIFVFLCVSVFTHQLAAQVLDKPLAIVRLIKTEQIGVRDFQKYLDSLQKQLGITIANNQKRTFLERRIDSLLLNQAAERDRISISEGDLNTTFTQQRTAVSAQVSASGAQISEELFRRLVSQQTGLTWEEYAQSVRDRLTQEKYLYIKRPQLQTTQYSATESEIQTLYEQQANKFVSPSMVRFDYLFVDTRNKDAAQKQALRQKIEDFGRQVRAGGKAAFEELVKKSLDDVGYSGGDFGYIIRGEEQTVTILGKGFVDAVFALETNAFSGVLESNLGFYIVNITDKRSPRLLGLDDPLLPGQKMTVREQIKNAVISSKANQAMSAALDSLVKEIRAQAEITMFEQNFTW